MINAAPRKQRTAHEIITILDQLLYGVLAVPVTQVEPAPQVHMISLSVVAIIVDGATYQVLTTSPEVTYDFSLHAAVYRCRPIYRVHTDRVIISVITEELSCLV